MVVGFKQKNPVEAQHRAEDQELDQVFPHRRMVYRFMPDSAEKQQKQKPDRRAGQGDHT